MNTDRAKIESRWNLERQWRCGDGREAFSRHTADTEQRPQQPSIRQYNHPIQLYSFDYLTTRLDSTSITRLFDRICGAAVRLIGHLWIAMQSFHQGYALINQYFGGLKGLRIRTPGRRQSYRIGGGSDGLLLGAHIRMWLSHGALLGELMRTRLRSEYNFKEGILED